MDAELDEAFLRSLHGMSAEEVKKLASRDAGVVALWIQSSGYSDHGDALEWLKTYLSGVEKAEADARKALVRLDCPRKLVESPGAWEEFKAWTLSLNGTKPDDVKPVVLAMSARSLQEAACCVQSEGLSLRTVADFSEAQQRFASASAQAEKVQQRIDTKKNRKCDPDECRALVEQIQKAQSCSLTYARKLAAAKLKVSLRTVEEYTVQHKGRGRPKSS